MLLAHVLCRARLLLWQMVKRGDLPEPTSAAHLAKLKPLRVGGKMKEAACRDPSKAKYLGQCCGGTRIWGDFHADEYVDGNRNSFAVFCCGACRLPLPLPLPPAPVAASPVTLTGAQIAAMEEKRQAALARKRAREETPPPPPPQMHQHAADALRPGALHEDCDPWHLGRKLGTRVPCRSELQSEYWKLLISM